MMDQILDFLPPVPGPHPQRFCVAIFLLIGLIGQLIYLLVRNQQRERYQWRRRARARQRYNNNR
jgi:hypothetical protein